MSKNIIEFIRKKDFKFLKDIGQGGTGKTVLLKDEIIDALFVCKKYSPYYEEHKETFFENFIDEIKILHLLYHRNIVRIFNYYLYPEQKTGYILMEHVEGKNISDYLKDNPHRIDDLFYQTILGFRYLEENGILHRDIRPDNILISDRNVVKIIDFGFGKKIEFENDFDNSISLNWRFSPPNEFKKKTYDFGSELYFIGKLFEELIKEYSIGNFSYSPILLLMIEKDYDKRISTFFEIERRILDNESSKLQFSDDEREAYQEFANWLIIIYSKIEDTAEYISNLDEIEMGLEEIYRNSMLENFVQNPATLSRCFVRGNFRYFPKQKMPIYVLKDFLKVFRSVSNDKKKVLLNHLWQRLDTIDRFSSDTETDDLPF